MERTMMFKYPNLIWEKTESLDIKKHIIFNIENICFVQFYCPASSQESAIISTNSEKIILSGRNNYNDKTSKWLKNLFLNNKATDIIDILDGEKAFYGWFEGWDHLGYIMLPLKYNNSGSDKVSASCFFLRHINAVRYIKCDNGYKIIIYYPNSTITFQFASSEDSCYKNISKILAKYHISKHNSFYESTKNIYSHIKYFDANRNWIRLIGDNSYGDDTVILDINVTQISQIDFGSETYFHYYKRENNPDKHNHTRKMAEIYIAKNIIKIKGKPAECLEKFFKNKYKTHFYGDEN